MRKVIVMVLFCTMVGSSVMAQRNLFNVEPDFQRSFRIELENEESMKLEVMSVKQLSELPDADSLARMFLTELKSINDSLAAPRYAKRIDMLLDGTGEPKLRVRNWVRPEQYYIVVEGSPGKLKYEQDTVTITGLHDSTGNFYRYTYYLNYYTNLSEYADGGLHHQIALVSENLDKKWRRNAAGLYSPSGVDYISSTAEDGKSGINSMLLLRTSLDIQNYREMFIPSISIGMAVAKRKRKIYQEFGIGSELHFRFAKDQLGHSRTFINSFVTVSYGRGKETSAVNPPLRLFPYLAVSYNVRSKGDVYEPNTFRLGVGRFFIGNLSTKIEPSLYISGLFKSATPSFRIVQMF